MKINNININKHASMLSFQNNKRLNKKLKERLSSQPDNMMYQAVDRINDTCNFTEDIIRKLEKKDKSGIEKNKSQIEFYLNYFIDAKIALAEMIERLFPDLNYFANEMDKYDEEDMESINPFDRDEPQDKSQQEPPTPAYFWRSALASEAACAFETLEKNSHYFGVEDCENQKTQANDYLKEKANQKIDKSSLVEKFEPDENSPTSLDDVVGLDKCVNDIKDLIIFPLANPQLAMKRKEEYGIEVPNFTIFFGPPGCGKTTLAQAISAETGCDMYKFDFSKIGSSYVNETATNIGEMFDYVKEKANKSQKPVILFIDEMDSILSQRSNDASRSSEDNKAVDVFLPLIQDCKKNNILIIGATNMYDLIDTAIKRRAGYGAYIGLPSQKEIKKLLTKILSKYKKGQTLSKDDIALEILSRKLLGFSPSNINSIFKTASLEAFKDNERDIQEEDFEYAIENTDLEKINEKNYLPQNKRTTNQIGFTFKGE